MNAALARFPIDPDRLAVTGTSYGGYMTNWNIGHETCFKAAVTINSVSNLVSSFGTSDVDAVFGIIEQSGNPWNRQAFYWERSPIAYMPAVTTPTRVIGTESDWHCSIEQSEQVFTALKYLRRAKTDFIRVPDVSHSINLGTPGI
jgi:dipeptidyl aminopeptidase/acylaminoacyl peptidase